MTLEVTESAIMHNVQKSLAVVNCIHELGFRLAIDDFGTGHSALSQVRRLPLDELKIDKSFVTHAGDAKDDAILRTTIDLAHQLGLERWSPKASRTTPRWRGSPQWAASMRRASVSPSRCRRSSFLPWLSQRRSAGRNGVVALPCGHRAGRGAQLVVRGAPARKILAMQRAGSLSLRLRFHELRLRSTPDSIEALARRGRLR